MFQSFLLLLYDDKSIVCRSFVWLLHCVPKNKTRVILNVSYTCKSIAVKFSVFILMTLAIKRIHITCHLTLVMFLQYPTFHKNGRGMWSSSH